LAFPFVLFVAIFNPLLDRQILLQAGPLALSGGWLSFFSILLRLCLTVGAALILIATTGFNGVCAALERLGAPRAFVVQLLFLYRYIFVLADEGGRMARARELRTFDGRGLEMRTYSSLVAHLLLRTIARARRVHLAMLSRGFNGVFTLRRSFDFGWREAFFTAGWSALFICLRAVDLPQLLGTALLEVAR
ncbi:MAG TPA: energy-coupling factor transporter transmembrane component T, partial [Geobacteraceae bacterium]